MTVPPGALSQPTTITMNPAAPSRMPAGGIEGGTAYQMSPEGLQFSVPAVITMAVTPSALPAGTAMSDLGVFTAPAVQGNCGPHGDSAICPDKPTDLLATVVTDGTHVGAAIIHFSFLWVAAKSSPGSQARFTSTGCQGGVGAAVCVSFSSAICSPCNCADGYPCPGDDVKMCCRCSDGTSCPFNKQELCGKCPTLTGGGTKADGGAGVDGGGNPSPTNDCASLPLSACTTDADCAGFGDTHGYGPKCVHNQFDPATGRTGCGCGCLADTDCTNNGYGNGPVCVNYGDQGVQGGNPPASNNGGICGCRSDADCVAPHTCAATSIPKNQCGH